jgi:hypothetical protein
MSRISFNTTGSFLIVLLLTTLMSVALAAVQRFLPGWRPTYLLVACGLIALESTYVQHVIRRERMWLSEGARYLVVELVALLVLMRVVSLVEFGPAELWAWARTLLQYPLAFFDYLYLGYILVGLVVGVAGHAFARDLADLAPREFEQASSDASQNARLLQQVGSDRIEALGRLSARFVGGGMLLLLALALQSVDLEQLAAPVMPLATGAVLAAVCYFASGFLLYSQARLALLQSRWRLEGVAVAAGIGRRWTLWSLLLIGGVLVAALLVPRSYDLGLFDTTWVVMQGLSYLLVLIGYFLVSLISLLAVIPVLLLSLLAGGAAVGIPRNLPPPPPPPVELVERTPPLLPALVFWGCMAFLVGYALLLFAQRHPGLRRVLGFERVARWWAELRVLWGGAAAWGQQVLRRVGERFAPLQPAPRVRQRLPRIVGLPPREAIRVLYQGLLLRAREQGLPRGRGQTPYEYADELQQRLPAGRTDIAALTDAFVAAEYSRRPVGDAELRAAWGPWRRLLRLLRRATR